MKNNYWYERATYQDLLSLAGIFIWMILGCWGILESWRLNNPVQTPLVILPVNMIVLTFVNWYLKRKTNRTAQQERQLLITGALLIISVSAWWVYQI